MRRRCPNIPWMTWQLTRIQYNWALLKENKWEWRREWAQTVTLEKDTKLFKNSVSLQLQLGMEWN